MQKDTENAYEGITHAILQIPPIRHLRPVYPTNLGPVLNAKVTEVKAVEKQIATVLPGFDLRATSRLTNKRKTLNSNTWYYDSEGKL